MNRNLARLSDKVYDVLIIGGGIYGLFTAWDAALRGLSVALVEKGDFCHATSSNSQRVIHGGLRYLQSGDIRRMRQSIRERTNFMRIAPHLVHPLPFLIPAYGHGLRGKHALSLAFKVHDLVGFDRNQLADPHKYLPASRALSGGECLELFPGIADRGLTGAFIYYDSQVHSSERLSIAVLRSAIGAGAAMANYVEMTEFLAKEDRVTGVRAKDVLTGDQLEIRARVLVNCCGPWFNRVLGLFNGRYRPPELGLSKAFTVSVGRQLTEKYAFGVYGRGRFKDLDATGSKGSRMYFITPWETGSLVGAQHLAYDCEPDEVQVTEEELEGFLSDVNEAYPPAALKQEDVCVIYAGLLPAWGHGTDHVQLVKHYRIHDHQKERGLNGLISVVGVKFTESRLVAEKAVDLAFNKLGRAAPKCSTSVTPLHGGQIERFERFMAQEVQKEPKGLDSEAVRHLVRRYGSAYREVVERLDNGAEPAEPVSGISNLLKAEVIQGVRNELAQRLTDVVFRRTALGVTGSVGDAQLNACSAIMAAELGWSQARAQREVEELKEELKRVGARVPAPREAQLSGRA